MERWIAVDWGTSNLRVWLMDADRKLAEAGSDKGMNALQPGAFEAALLEVIDPWLRSGEVMTVVACGMVGARQGWMEAPYRFLPCRPAAADAPLAVPTQDPRIAVSILPGLAQAEPADVMRGEETQVAGFLAKHPGFAGSLCLPGTHSKWIQLEGGQVLSFATFMTGELFALLAEHSVLRHSLRSDEEDEAAFLDAVLAAFHAPRSMLGHLFALRAADLLHGLAPATGRSRLSGTLIGAELAAATAAGDCGDLGLIAGPGLGKAYLAALGAIGRDAIVESGEEMVLSGLVAAKAVIAPFPLG